MMIEQEDPGHPHGTLLRSEDAQGAWPRRRVPPFVIFIPSVGGVPRGEGLLGALRLRREAPRRSARREEGGQAMTVFEVLLPAFVAGLIVTGMLAYLGVHVVERGVIFVDLSLAQIAALGTTVGYPRRLRHALGHGPRLLARLRADRRRRLRLFPRASQHPHPPGGDHRDRLRGRCGGAILVDVQGDERDRAPQGDARRQHPFGFVEGARRRRPASSCSWAPSTSPAPEVPADLHERAGSRGAQGLSSASGTSCSTAPSASS